METAPAECYTRPEVKPLPEAVFDDDGDHDSGSEFTNESNDSEEELVNESEAKIGSFEEAD